MVWLSIKRAFADNEPMSSIKNMMKIKPNMSRKVTSALLMWNSLKSVYAIIAIKEFRAEMPNEVGIEIPFVYARISCPKKIPGHTLLPKKRINANAIP